MIHKISLFCTPPPEPAGLDQQSEGVIYDKGLTQIIIEQTPDLGEDAETVKS